jgi:hypothetical protein
MMASRVHVMWSSQSFLMESWKATAFCVGLAALTV